MNYKPFVGWGFWGAVNAAGQAHFYASWGLMALLPTGVATVMAVFMHYYRMLRG